ncbi:CBS domain-containing protein [Dactylosporangium sp. NPDC049140]|jgi:CBS domain-containing protein|uniref:CBS domain-containing protein n=1 Tax=Dactylosporangium sp. NPDC049140 TaxID=3155647 RepID=UPI0033E0EACF
MRVKDIMSSPACTVRADAPLGDAVALLEERSITAAPVVDDDGMLVGMVSELDLLRQRLARTRLAAGPLRVREAMSGLPMAAWPEAHVAAVAQAMVEHGAHTVPVVVDEHVIGVVSRCDVLRTLLPTAASAQRDA